MKPQALILQARGTNRDGDVAEALTLAGAQPNILPLRELRADRKKISNYQMLIVAGGFSYADSLGAGKLLALDLNSYFHDEIAAFVEAGKPVMGICNGFQALVKSGILPAPQMGGATLTFNAQGHFECRWVTLKSASQTCVWTRELNDLIECPVAHGEGNFQAGENFPMADFLALDQIALVYTRVDGSAAGGEYPYNPNGSVYDIAGICNPQGNVLGLMPHPENHIHAYQHPLWARGARGRGGLALFQNGVKYASEM